jgi:hypothetical protein
VTNSTQTNATSAGIGVSKKATADQNSTERSQTSDITINHHPSSKGEYFKSEKYIYRKD